MQGTEIQELIKDYEVIINRLRNAEKFEDEKDVASLKVAVADCHEKAEKLGCILEYEEINGKLRARARLSIERILDLVNKTI